MAAAYGARAWPTPPAANQERTRSRLEECFPSTTGERCGACLPPTKTEWRFPSAAPWPAPVEDLRRLRRQSKAEILLRQTGLRVSGECSPLLLRSKPRPSMSIRCSCSDTAVPAAWRSQPSPPAPDRCLRPASVAQSRSNNAPLEPVDSASARQTPKEATAARHAEIGNHSA